MEKVIGILGGMGPEATVDCFEKIIKNTPAARDQDHLRVVIDSNPKVPDRTAAIIGNGESPVPVLAAGCRALERAGADFIIIPCVSAHVFLTEIQQQSELPILSIFDAVAEAVIRDYPQIQYRRSAGNHRHDQRRAFSKAPRAGCNKNSRVR